MELPINPYKKSLTTSPPIPRSISSKDRRTSRWNYPINIIIHSIKRSFASFDPQERPIKVTPSPPLNRIDRDVTRIRSNYPPPTHHRLSIVVWSSDNQLFYIWRTISFRPLLRRIRQGANHGVAVPVPETGSEGISSHGVRGVRAPCRTFRHVCVSSLSPSLSLSLCWPPS